MIPNHSLLQTLAETNNISNKSHEQLVHDQQMRDLVLKELQITGKKAGLAPFEIIEGVVLTDSEWSSQNVSVIWWLLEGSRSILTGIGFAYAGSEAK